MTLVRFALITLIIICLVSCHYQKVASIDKLNIVPFEYKALTSDKNIRGSVLIYDLNKDKYYSNDFNWAKIGRIPASTYKIPHSLIALELGIVEYSDSLLKWNGESRYLQIWEQDLTFKQAFTYSCVPCYQEIAHKVGVERMNNYIEKLNFGQMDIGSDNIDNFWLVGNSKISQFEAIDFLKRLYLSELPISKRTEQIFKELIIVKQTDELLDDYTLRAKTGLSVSNKSYNGWYIGYIETPSNVYFFATNISPTKKYDKSFNDKRKNITIRALRQLGLDTIK
ncbi:Beta-lactamase [hydrothermal vent metagenome]|uniref:Beta-lactamase n=1 Tax=hydrothermal vent metagenome TaxID=652676 RepID=A0A3B0V5E0_9ZZZZ